ncbi:serine hydrolase domain-containing protein [Agromyces atrinae]|uniref:Class A beta-lactamase-related serine hydrolase n=1 Tax=Agromyces atrinae TaxID=592376 RepID=A0A4Q2M675_9MICO|nr:serine hydrolase domain-containing protein [Agromyces atrinae]NYD66770.1 CubicO group peptidase (beta-lactamase class C family) [Agromyces atrinae]RXZ87428.1 class A beta-lactamase-related serine hydrolase [Agromyces atrinae]
MTDITRLVAELDGGDFSGVVLVRKDGEEVLATARGLASERWSVPNTLDTRFDTASITKLFTSVAVLQQVDAGALDLDASIHDYVDLDGTTISRDVTLRHLLTHTSGIADDADEEAGEDYAELFVDKPNYSIMETADFLPQFAYKEPNAAPGEQCRYCNVGYILAGLALERATGERYREYAVREVFGRAGMERSGFFDRRDAEPDVAEGGDRDDDGRWVSNIYSYPPIGSPDGGAHVTARDLLRFLDAVRAGELLSAASTELFLTPAVQHDERLWNAYGLEFHGRTFFKEGINAGASGALVHFGATGVDVVVLSNTEDGAWQPLRVAGELFGGPDGDYGPVGG